MTAMRIGTNIARIDYYEPNCVMPCNLLRGNDWYSSTFSAVFPYGGAYRDANRNVISLAATGGFAYKALAYYARLGGFYPGTWCLRWKGNGNTFVPQWDLHFDTSPSFDGTYWNINCHITDTVTDAVMIMLTVVNPADPPTDVQLLPPGGIILGDPFTWIPDPGGSPPLGYKSFKDGWNDRTVMFMPHWMQNLQGYHKCGFRFMELMGTNGNGVVDWVDHITWDRCEWTNGIPLEAAIGLCNQTLRGAWFSMYAKASNDLMTQFYTLVQATLNPLCHVYCEYGNEAWNGPLYTRQYIDTVRGSQLWYDWFAQRSVDLFILARAVCPRVERVMGSQWGSVGVTNAVLNSVTTHGIAKNFTDAICIAPYFGIEAVENFSTSTHLAWAAAGSPYTDLFDNLETVGVPSMLPQNLAHRNAVNAIDPSIRILGYEGGQTLVVRRDEQDHDFIQNTLTNMYIAVQREPRMGDCYAAFLSDMAEQGVIEEFFHFTNCCEPGIGGFWGAEEIIGDDPAERPKFDELMAYTAANPDTGGTTYDNPGISAQIRFPLFVQNGNAP